MRLTRRHPQPLTTQSLSLPVLMTSACWLPLREMPRYWRMFRGRLAKSNQWWSTGPLICNSQRYKESQSSLLSRKMLLVSWVLTKLTRHHQVQSHLCLLTTICTTNQYTPKSFNLQFLRKRIEPYFNRKEEKI